jgi:hypothetical protein
MKRVVLIIALGLTSCSKWTTVMLVSEETKELDPIHVHLYHHQDREWSCLNLSDTSIQVTDTLIVRYRKTMFGKTQLQIKNENRQD